MALHLHRGELQEQMTHRKHLPLDLTPLMVRLRVNRKFLHKPFLVRLEEDLLVPHLVVIQELKNLQVPTKAKLQKRIKQ
jgi:hypothetical protein